LIDGATCHEAGDFIIKAKMYKIWVVKYPSHQTYLLQPLDVGCFRQWKQYQNGNIWNGIRSFEAEYNVCSFFRDLLKLRDKTFTKRTIKHSFHDSGMWPVSFKQVRRKIKVYGKKNKKDTGLDFLEYNGEPDPSDSDDHEEDDQSDLIPDPELEGDYQLPLLLPPASYTDCVFQFKELDNKIEEVLSSPSRRKYKTVREGTDKFLMRGSLHAQEILNTRRG
jgi:DDE superfamily endonuclease